MNNRIVEIDLNNAYWAHDNKAYKEKVESVKAMGFRVFRDDNGNHKVQPTGDSTSVYDAFGGIFGDIFSGKGGN